MDFNDIIEEYNLKKIKISERLLYYIENECDTLYFLPSELYQNLIITARTYYEYFILIVYPVDNIEEVIKCFMEFKTLPLRKYVISTTENINIRFIVENNLLDNINDIVNINYIILERSKYKYKIPFSDTYIEGHY